MPELPEVETVCRGLEPVMTGQKIVSIDLRRGDLRRPFPKDFAARLKGRTVLRLSRRAKYILVHLDCNLILALHLGMSGRMAVAEKNYIPKKHDHLLIHLINGHIIVFNDPRRFGMAELITEDARETHSLFAHLGPEPLANAFSGPVLAASLKGRTTSIKTAIMDQRIVVGVGNIYASESLFAAGIDPARVAGTVTGERAEKLVAAIRAVLHKAITMGGSTLRDHRQADGALGYFQHHFSVYNREGQACPGCTCDVARTKGIRRIIQGGRATFYCPRKQK